MTEREPFAVLQAENVRLVALLESHGIAWRATPAASQPALIAPVSEPAPAPPGPSLSTAEKVALFRRLFRGRTDVYPVRWEGKTSGKSGYAPACANEWRAGVCEKPRIKCGDCSHRLLVPLSYQVVIVMVMHFTPHTTSPRACWHCLARAGLRRAAQPGVDLAPGIRIP